MSKKSDSTFELKYCKLHNSKENRTVYGLLFTPRAVRILNKSYKKHNIPVRITIIE